MFIFFLTAEAKVAFLWMIHIMKVKSFFQKEGDEMRPRGTHYWVGEVWLFAAVTMVMVQLFRLFNAVNVTNSSRWFLLFWLIALIGGIIYLKTKGSQWIASIIFVATTLTSLLAAGVLLYFQQDEWLLALLAIIISLVSAGSLWRIHERI